MPTKMLIKLLVSTAISLISSFLSTSIKNFNTYQSFITYVVGYFISLVLFLMIKRISSKNFKNLFWFILSIIDFLLFFLIEFSILSDECTTMQKITNLNRIIYLFLRYLVINELLIAEPMKIGLISILYVGNILIYFFLINANISIQNLFSLFLGLLSIILTLSILGKSQNNEILINTLKQCYECFFLIKKGETNDIMHIQGAILNSLSLKEQKKIHKTTNLTKSYLNCFFVIEKKYFTMNNIRFMDDSIFIKNQDEEYIEYDINRLIKNILRFEKGKDIKIKVRVKQNLSKNISFLIKYIVDKGNTYILFAVVEAEPYEKNDKKEMPYGETKIRELFISYLKILKKFIVKIQSSVQKLASANALDEEKIDLIKALNAHLKINLLQIENLFIILSDNDNEISSKLTKTNIITFVKDILNIMIPIAKARKVGINFSVDEFRSGLIIKSDLEKLRQILLNLLLTSVKDAEPNSTINFSVIFIGENIKEIQFVIQDPLLIMSQDRLKAIKSLMNGQMTHFELMRKNINLSVTQKLLSFLGGQEALNITSQIEKGSIYDLIIKPIKIYSESPDKPKSFSLISCSKSDSKIIGQTRTQRTQNTINLTTNEFKSSGSSIKIEECFNLNHLNCNNLKTDSTRKFNLDSFQKSNLDSSNIIPLIHKSNIEQASCSCKEILFICNNFFNLNLIKTILTSLKLECCVVENEEKAIIKLTSQNNCYNTDCQGFKIILIDCFPSEECPSLIGKVKNIMDEGLISTIPILGTVSLISKEQILQCLDSGMTDFIPNPLNKNTFLNSIIKLIDL